MDICIGSGVDEELLGGLVGIEEKLYDALQCCVNRKWQ